jgi:hypothetical protein
MCGEVSEFAVWGKARHLGERKRNQQNLFTLSVYACIE